MLTAMAVEAQEKVQNRGTIYSIDLCIGCFVTRCGSKHQRDVIILGSSEGLGWVSASGLVFLDLDDHDSVNRARRRIIIGNDCFLAHTHLNEAAWRFHGKALLFRTI